MSTFSAAAAAAASYSVVLPSSGTGHIGGWQNMCVCPYVICYNQLSVVLWRKIESLPSNSVEVGWPLLLCHLLNKGWESGKLISVSYMVPCHLDSYPCIKKVLAVWAATTRINYRMVWAAFCPIHWLIVSVYTLHRQSHTFLPAALSC